MAIFPSQQQPTVPVTSTDVLGHTNVDAIPKLPTAFSANENRLANSLTGWIDDSRAVLQEQKNVMQQWALIAQRMTRMLGGSANRHFGTPTIPSASNHFSPHGPVLLHPSIHQEVF